MALVESDSKVAMNIALIYAQLSTLYRKKNFRLYSISNLDAWMKFPNRLNTYVYIYISLIR